MGTLDKKLRIRLNLQIDEKTKEMSEVLREKHHINLSSVCREAIKAIYSKLEK